MKPPAPPQSRKQRRAQGKDTANLQTLMERAAALQGRGDAAGALGCIDQVLAARPGHAPAHFERANILSALGRHDEALAGYDRAEQLRPGYPPVANNRGGALEALGRPEEALICYDRAVALAPDFAPAHFNRGTLLRNLGRFDEALESFDRAMALAPEVAALHHNRATVLEELGRLDDALAGYDRAIALQPDYPDAHYNRGNALRSLARLEAALASFDRAIQLAPDYAEAQNNRGNVLKDLGRLDEAVASFERIIAIRPEHHSGHYNLALCRLYMGDYSRGLPDYEWRWEDPQLSAERRAFDVPLWLGAEPLSGKTILLHGEQGLGDILQFCRYAPMVKGLGGRVILEVREPLVDLLTALEGVDLLLARGAALPEFDFHCPLMSLPLAFATTVETIPAPVRYLQADPARATAWRARLGPAAKPRVGLAWSGNPNHPRDRERSIAFADIATLLSPDIEWFSLHRDLPEMDAQGLHTRTDIRHFGAEMTFAETAALAEAMDLIISVDTAIAHLAGALGRPVWILLPHRPDWRWMTERAGSPWYPSARLFRQDAPGDWAGVLARAARALQAEFPSS